MGKAIEVSPHAIQRYCERVDPVAPAEAMRRLSAPIFERAARLGCCAVKLGGGQQVIMRGPVIVTVLPKGRVPR